MSEAVKKISNHKKKIFLITLISIIISVLGSLFIEDVRRSLCKITKGEFCLLLPSFRGLDGQEYVKIQSNRSVVKVCGEGANHINYSLCLKDRTLEECKKPKVPPQKNPVFDNVDRVIIAVDNYSNNEKTQALLPDILKHQSLEKLLQEKYESRYKELPEGTEPSDYKRCYNRQGQSVTVYPYKTKKEKEKFHKKAEKAGTLAVITRFNIRDINDEFGKPLTKVALVSVSNLRSDVKQDHLKFGGFGIIPLNKAPNRIRMRINGALGGSIK